MLTVTVNFGIMKKRACRFQIKIDSFVICAVQLQQAYNIRMLSSHHKLWKVIFHTFVSLNHVATSFDSLVDE